MCGAVYGATGAPRPLPRGSVPVRVFPELPALPADLLLPAGWRPGPHDAPATGRTRCFRPLPEWPEPRPTAPAWAPGHGPCPPHTAYTLTATSSA